MSGESDAPDSPVQPSRPAVATYYASLTAHHPAGPVGELVRMLAKGDLDPAAMERHIERHGLAREDWYRRQATDLAIGFIDHCLLDGSLDQRELADIQALNAYLDLNGAYFKLRPAEVAARLAAEMERMLEDAVITQEEELYQVELQTAFMLGYDDYLSLIRVAVERSHARLCEWANSGGSQAKSAAQKLAHLDSLYQLVTARPRRSGALY
jgi:hypothetical protein